LVAGWGGNGGIHMGIHGKWPIEIDGLPIKNGDFPWLC